MRIQHIYSLHLWDIPVTGQETMLLGRSRRSPTICLAHIFTTTLAASHVLLELPCSWNLIIANDGGIAQELTSFQACAPHCRQSPQQANNMPRSPKDEVGQGLRWNAGAVPVFVFPGLKPLWNDFFLPGSGPFRYKPRNKHGFVTYTPFLKLVTGRDRRKAFYLSHGVWGVKFYCLHQSRENV